MKRVVIAILVILSGNCFAQIKMENTNNIFREIVNIQLIVTAEACGDLSELEYTTKDLLGIIRKDYSRDKGAKGIIWVRKEFLKKINSADTFEKVATLKFAKISVLIKEFCFDSEEKNDYVSISVDFIQPVVPAMRNDHFLEAVTWSRETVIANFKPYEAAGFIRDFTLETLYEFNELYTKANK